MATLTVLSVSRDLSSAEIKITNDDGTTTIMSVDVQAPVASPLQGITAQVRAAMKGSVSSADLASKVAAVKPVAQP